MAESQRRPVPRIDAPELETALAFLDFQREAMLIKCDGLSDEQLRAVLVDTGTNLLGLVAHLTVSEDYWFSHNLAGRDERPKWDFGMQVPADTSPDEVFAAYREAWRASNKIVREFADLSRPTAVTIDGQHLPARWVLAHMTAETARHTGHADIIRELLDGATGR
jgi:uncharacterized damage-inducible protein DinB